jgi:hypothetical protein
VPKLDSEIFSCWVAFRGKILPRHENSTISRRAVQLVGLVCKSVNKKYLNSVANNLHRKTTKGYFGNTNTINYVLNCNMQVIENDIFLLL